MGTGSSSPEARPAGIYIIQYARGEKAQDPSGVGGSLGTAS
jgi:hypothetical protein